MKINNDYWRSVLTVTKVSPDTGSPENRSESFQNLVPGQQVKGEVLARLSDQVYLVKIEGTMYRTELPDPVHPGSQLALTFRTREPRPEFSLQNVQSDASPVRLSPTVASLNEILNASSAQPASQAAKSLEPLLTSPLANTTGLAASLRNALSFSGLFYESHLLQWFLGERLLADIQKESRIRLAAMGQNAKKQIPAGADSEDPDIIADIENFLTGTVQNDELMSNRNNISTLSDQAAASHLREQVEALLSGVFHWQGSVWQNQEMEWEVEKHGDKREHDCEQTWRTTIRLTLPNLGDVTATLVSNEEGIAGRITTDSAESKQTMKKELATLEERMSASGLSLTTMTIEQRDER